MCTKWGDCRPLIKLDRPFCEHYGFKLDKYVNASVGKQQLWNDRLWKRQEQYYRVYFEGQNFSASPECMEQMRFAGCYYMFPGCDRSTSGFRSKKFCKESCLHFANECSSFSKALKDVFLQSYPEEKALLSCLETASRNAGDSPECMYYDRKERLENEGRFGCSEYPALCPAGVRSDDWCANLH